MRCVEGECRSKNGDPGLEGSCPRSVTIRWGLVGDLENFVCEECRSENGDPGLERSCPRTMTVPGGLRGFRVCVRGESADRRMEILGWRGCAQGA